MFDKIRFRGFFMEVTIFLINVILAWGLVLLLQSLFTSSNSNASSSESAQNVEIQMHTASLKN